MTKAEARKELQRRLAKLKQMMRDEVEDFAVEHQLEFEFMGLKFFLKDPGGSNRYAPKGIFIPASEWQSSSWGCGGETEAYDRFTAWEEKYFPYEDDDLELDDEGEDD